MKIYEAYKKMNNDELLGRFKKINDYYNDVKIIILEELMERTLIHKEEFDLLYANLDRINSIENKNSKIYPTDFNLSTEVIMNRKKYAELTKEELIEKYRNWYIYNEKIKYVIMEMLLMNKMISKEEFENRIQELCNEIQNIEVVKPIQETINKKTNAVYTIPQGASFGVAGFVGLFLLGGLFIINYVFISFVGGIHTINWKETEAKIITIDKIEREVTGKDKQVRIIELYRMSYQYVVNGDEFISDRMKPLKSEDLSSQNTIGRQHKIGDKIKIYYDPDDPSQSIVLKYSLIELLMLLIAMLMIYIFKVLAKKAERDHGLQSSKNAVLYLIILFQVIIIIMLYPALLGN